jgi:carbamoyl-phosphate synthase small subunit
MTMADRAGRGAAVARRGFGDKVLVEGPPGSSRGRAGGNVARGKVSAAHRGGAGRRPAASSRIVGAPRIEYPRASMDSSLVPALLATPRPARLGLADGAVFSGYAAAGDAVASGEVVFNTSMFGYQEMLTDPSYRGQILVLTAAHVGNVGVNDDDQESGRVWAEGLIVPDLSVVPSNWRAAGAILERLAAQGVPVAWGFDTRALVLHLREKGALPGVLVCGREPSSGDLDGLVRAARGTDGCDLTGDVSRREIETWSAGPWTPPGAAQRTDSSALGARSTVHGPRVVVIDCGAKRSILRQLVGAGAEVVVVPAGTSGAAVLELRPAGVVVSNGPGDPGAVAGVPETLRAVLGKVPVLGICLGHQVLARALGGRTFKLRFGHHGANHPVRDDATGAVWITSQNHNYAVDASSLPSGVRVSMTNLTDGSVEGLVAEDLRAEGIQFHPEAGPGPHDALGVFARFVWRCRSTR